MDKSKVALFFHTLKYLKLKQICYRIYYTFKNHFLKIKIDNKVEHISQKIDWNLGIATTNSYRNGKFTFLNLEHHFEIIDWNYSNFGKLWTYNLNYFDFLNQEKISKKEGLTLIHNYIKRGFSLKDGLEPYPISLRLINWIKFISKHKIQDEKIDATLAKHLSLLNKNLEFHLLGNHLLENTFALLFGAYYFGDERIYRKSKKILEFELNEQILNDGAHFELSPMYHQLLLTRLLDCINLVDNNRWKEDDLLDTMKKKAEVMLGWLNEITYQNGQIPLVSDSSYGIAVCSKDIFDYANNLKLKIYNSKLSDSGYRKWNEGYLEILMDVGQIGPDYIPSHAHADTFNFEFIFKGQPIIVDTGISTYEKNTRRELERSTESHNTIRIDEKDSSEVWAGFRVARRAKIISLKEEKDKIKATHDGYKKLGVLHTRTFNRAKNKFVIEDCIESNRTHQIESFLHFHPECEVTMKGASIQVGSELKINIINSEKTILEEYDYSVGFNKTKKAKKIRAFVKKHSKIEVYYAN